LYGSENIVEKAVIFIQNTKTKMDIALDHLGPCRIVQLPAYRDCYKDILARGAKIRCVTEVTSENIKYCKELLSVVSELRHLDGIKGGIAINESEYMATTVLRKEQAATHLIYSDVDEVVAQGQYLFDTLWKNAVPAIRKIMEIEEGITKNETKILTRSSGSLSDEELVSIFFDSNELSVCITTEGLKIGYELFLPLTKSLLERKKDGSHKGIRILIEVSEDNMNLIKEYLEMGVKIRHLKETPFINFGVTESHLAAAIEQSTDKNFVDSVLYSNEPAYVNNFKSLFDKLWNNSKDATAIIKSIEDDIEIPFFETIEKSDETFRLIKNLISSANQEILGILPTFDSFKRQVENNFFLNIKNMTEKRNLSIKILVTDRIDQSRQKTINELFKDDFTLLEVKKRKFGIDDVNNKPFDFTVSAIKNMKIRAISNNDIQSEVGLLVVDRSKSIIIEFKDNTTEDPLDSTGLASYSNSIPISNSYAFIFDSLWNQSELYYFLKKVYASLKVHDKMQREFIDVVAHELRTPIQPIIGLTEHVKDNIFDNEQKGLLEIVIASAHKLHTLTENILTVTKIEGNLFNISRSKFNLTEVILDVIKDFETILENKNKIVRISEKKIKFEFIGFEKEHIVNGDKLRITQVISNLIDNSINFIAEGEDGIITTSIRNNENDLIVQIKDNGEGIHPEILPRLFTKFATKSFYGTGLGLYICKNIINLHKGKIWVEHNKGGIGASISFTLPIFI
jgi:two-component system, OmpR family, sensor histidine kinase VicK